MAYTQNINCINNSLYICQIDSIFVYNSTIAAKSRKKRGLP